jgi:hypothetical protein
MQLIAFIVLHTKYFGEVTNLVVTKEIAKVAGN